MSRINVNAKADEVGGELTSPQDSSPAPITPEENSPTDNYQSSGTNPYRNLLSGRPKATIAPGPLAELTGAQDAVDNTPPDDPIRALIGTYMMGDYNPNRASVNDFEIPYVPIAERIQNAIPGVRNASLVSRYEALEMTIERLISYANRMLRPRNAVRLSNNEIAALGEYREALRERLTLCQNQLREARADLVVEERDRQVERARRDTDGS